jgi:hypothetical protein
MVTRWEDAARPASGARAGENEIVGTARLGGFELPLPRYGPLPPVRDFAGDVEALAFYAGQGCGLVQTVEPAGDLVRGLGREAAAIISERLARMVA